MLYQYDRSYLFDATKFARTFGAAATPYAEAIRRCDAATEERKPTA